MAKNILGFLFLLGALLVIYQFAFDFVYNPQNLVFRDPPAFENWTTYTNDRLGFSILYPQHLFLREYPDNEEKIVFTDHKYTINDSSYSELTIETKPAEEINLSDYPDVVMAKDQQFMATHAQSFRNGGMWTLVGYPVKRTYLISLGNVYYLIHVTVGKEWQFDRLGAMTTMIFTFTPR